MLARVVRDAVPAFADWCLLDLVGPDGTVQRVEVAHADPAQAELANRLTRAAPDARVAEALRAITPRSIISVPLVARGRALGALTFMTAQSGRRFDQADLDVAQELAKRCALAMDNATLYKDAQDAVRIRDEFLAIASHELKTPLTPLQLQLQTLERRLPRLVPEGEGAAWLRERLGILYRQSERLERLVNELLDISRIAGGRLRLELEPIDLSEVVRQVVGRAEESGETSRRNCQVTVQGVDARLVGQWDRLRLEQIVTIVLSNALKYGEGRPIEMALTSDATTAALCVTDHGIGIQPEHLERIFGRFERAVSSRYYGGLGLGLYIANQIVKAMSGSIRVNSTPGQGATFVVTLPLAAAGSPHG